MQISQVLFSQGFGTRRECESLVAAGFVSVQGVVCEDPWQQFDTDGLVFGVQGVSWPYRERALVVLNKPAGYECSQKPKHHASVVSLLPAPLRRRGLQPVGRLDEDTTGLLLLTDDGSLIHRLTSPRHHVPKVYEVVWGVPLDPRNFHRKVTSTGDFVVPTGTTTSGDAGRPAQLFRRGSARLLHPAMLRPPADG